MPYTRALSMPDERAARPNTGPPVPFARIRGWNWPALLLGALILATIAGTLAYPTYSNYDSTYSLIWGRELLGGELPSFDAYRAPTQHPLAVVFGAIMALFGYWGDRLLVFATLASFVVLAAGLYRLGRTTFTALVGVVAGVILCTRFDFPFLAARGYVDIPYLALIVWAAVLEAARPRRGRAVLVLLLLAGLLRPEAWVLSGVYWLWLFPRASWRERIEDALLVAAAPLIWAGTDFIVTGDPLFSQNHTSGLAEELGRNKGIGEVPTAMVSFLKALVKLPVAIAGLIGLGLAAWLAPTRVRVPLALLIVGLGTFVMVGAAGLSVINRYLLVPSLMVMLFAGVAVGGWTMLEHGRARTAWTVLAALGVAFALVWTLLRVDLARLGNELTLRGDARVGLKELLDKPQVRAAARCGPVLVPNHRLIPDVRWIMDLPEDRVVARSDEDAAAGVRTGLAILPARRSILLRNGLDPVDDSPQDTANILPPEGYVRIAGTAFYAAYARCT